MDVLDIKIHTRSGSEMYATALDLDERYYAKVRLEGQICPLEDFRIP